jgi:hypothetical protein
MVFLMACIPRSPWKPYEIKGFMLSLIIEWE